MKGDTDLKFLFLANNPITPPSINGFFNGSVLDNIASFFEFVFTFISNIVFAITNFYDTLVEINTYVIDLGNSAQSGITDGMPILESVGLYRYLMGDPVFYMTYILVLAGCLFTIYKLVLLLIAAFKQMKDNITGEGKTSAGLLSFVEKIFHS